MPTHRHGTAVGLALLLAVAIAPEASMGDSEQGNQPESASHHETRAAIRGALPDDAASGVLTATDSGLPSAGDVDDSKSVEERLTAIEDAVGRQSLHHEIPGQGHTEVAMTDHSSCMHQNRCESGDRERSEGHTTSPADPGLTATETHVLNHF